MLKFPPVIVEERQEWLGNRREEGEQWYSENRGKLMAIQEEKIKGVRRKYQRRALNKIEFSELHETENLSYSAFPSKFSPVTGSPQRLRILVWEIPWTEEPGRLTFHFHALEEEMATHSSVLA